MTSLNAAHTALDAAARASAAALAQSVRDLDSEHAFQAVKDVLAHAGTLSSAIGRLARLASDGRTMEPVAPDAPDLDYMAAAQRLIALVNGELEVCPCGGLRAATGRAQGDC